MSQVGEVLPEQLPTPPDTLSHGDVRLRLLHTVAGEPSRGFAPYYHFRILAPDDSDAGHINFRIGDSAHVQLYAGHVGFEIREAFRGRNYARQACEALAPFAASMYEAVIITCDPENSASRRTIEGLGATFIGEVPVPADEPVYQSGSRTKRRYRWKPGITQRRPLNLLDNIVWHALTGPHARFATGTSDVLRYAPGFSPIVAFFDPARPNFEALASFCEPGEHFYCEGWVGAVPAGWQIDTESTMFKMVWEGAIPAINGDAAAIQLRAEHATQALELAVLTRPGPFGPRTIELGDYFGFFEGDRLVAMAGERLCAATLREISGVCTHPDFQGRGFARALMVKLIRRQLERGETPFLHVMRDNKHARELYERMGFRVYREVVVRVISRSATAQVS